MSEKYQALLRELATTCFAKERLQQELDVYETGLAPLLSRDQQAALSRKKAGGGLGAPGIFGRPPALREFVVKRTASLADQIAGRSPGHIPSGGFGPGAFRIGGMVGGPMLEELDADRDQKLSKPEWLAGARRLFEACQKDDQQRVNVKSVADGLNSLFPKPEEGAPRGMSPGSVMGPPIVRRADADKDGKATLSELTVAAEKLFDEYDREKMGRIDETRFIELLNELFPPPGLFGPPAKRPEAPAKDEKAADEKP
jgi:hypothetical protein